jgi:RimJ/RimL family protein N-acetyltransferase
MLKRYEDRDFKLLESWVTGPEMLFQFAGTEFTYPITKEQIEDYRAKHPDRYFYVGYTDNVPFAFGEIIPQEHYPRLGRLLVGDPAMRGHGMGADFIRALISECNTLYGTDKVDIYVWEQNRAAIRCYQKVGFDFVPIQPFMLHWDNKAYNILKMTLVADAAN